MWGARVNEKCVSSSSLEASRGHLAETDMVGGGGNIKRISEKYDVKMWTKCSSFRIGSNSEFLI
jgi:hypothetical protein